MIRVLAALLAGLLLCAQTPMLPGFPPGTFQNRAALDGGGGGGYSQATTFKNAALLAFPGYDATHQAADTTYICGLVSAGIFAKLVGLQILATQDVSIAKINMINPGTYDLVNVNPADPVAFTVDRGAKVGVIGGNGLSTQFTPSTAGSSLYTLNSASIMVWSNTAGNTVGGEFGTTIGSNAYFITNSAVTGSLSSVNQSGAFTENTSSGYGMYVASRTSSSNVNNYWGASGTLTTLSSSSSASTSLPSDVLNVLLIGGYSNTNKQVSASAWGAALTGADVANFYTLTQARMTAVGN